MLELALQMPPTLGYVGLTLAIPVFLTALISVACGLLFVIAAAVGISLDNRAATTLTIAPLVAFVVWAAQAALAALRRRLPCGPVVTLAQIADRGVSITEVGAKAHTLACLRVRGARVAPGWVLRADVFERAGSPSSEAEALALAVPSAALKRLHRELEASGEAQFLLRSSFSGEDCEHHAAPGVYASVAWSRASGREALSGAIREVWASYWGSRALAYRAGQGEAARHPRLAVLAQPVLAHERSGVVASVDLVRGSRDAHLVDAGDWQGRHELLTDGVEALALRAQGPALPDESVRQISRLAGMAESLLGVPSEAEWGLVGGRVTLYQARALTGEPLPTTVTHRHIVELPRYPLTPLSDAFLWGEASPASVLSAGLTPLGLPALPERALVRVSGRMMLDVSAFKALTLGLNAEVGLKMSVVFAALLGRTGQGQAKAPTEPALDLEGLTASALLDRLKGLRRDRLRPCLEAQMRALTVAASLEAWLASASGEDGPPTPRVSRPDDGDAWYRAERGAELSSPRRGEAPSPNANLEPRATPSLPRHRAGLFVSWVAWARDRQLTEREALNAQLQVINYEARACALALDRQLSEAHSGWAEGDVFYCTLAELEACVVGGDALPGIEPRRVEHAAHLVAEVPGVCELDPLGAPLVRPEVASGEAEGVRGVTIGRGAFTGALCVLGDGQSPSVDAARGCIVVIHDASPVWSAHVMVAGAVVLADAGPLSHLALLARERGIPVLASVSGPLAELGHAARVTLDLERACLRREV